MLELYRLPVQSPLIYLINTHPCTINNETMVSFTFGNGVAEIDASKAGVNPEDTSLTVCAALGLENKAMGDLLGFKSAVVSRQLTKAYNYLPPLEGWVPEGTPYQPRRSLARHLFMSNAFRIIKRLEPIDLSETDRRIVNLASFGWRTLEISEALGYKPKSISRRIGEVSKRIGGQGGIQAIIAAFMSQEIELSTPPMSNLEFS